jgi:glycine/D-amino acid oxidase-like deaminating enzyme
MNASDTAAYGESLFAATRVAAPERPRLTFDLDVDVCVIGAGLAGLTTAREIARRGWSVAVLEAERIAWGASGRNTGFVLPGFGQTPQGMLDRVGSERAKRLWALSQAGLEYVRDTILETNMPGIERGTGWLAVSRIDAARAVAAETRLLGEEFGASVEMWPTARVRESLKSERYFQAIHFRDAFHIHSLNYALGLAASAEEAGARIFENTPALSMDPAGVRKRVTTPGGRVRSAHIVLAGNVYLDKLVPELARTLLPVTTYVVATERLGERLSKAIDYRGAVSDGQSADNHYRVASGDRLIWSGRMTTWQGKPQHFKRALARDIARTFPQLGKVTIDHAWSGTLGNAVHRMPQIGELSPGLWLASGFGGHGLNTTAMAGNLVARAIVEGSRTWRMFSPYELIWAGGSLGRASAQMMYWANRVKQDSAARLSRRREKKRSLAVEQQERYADATWNMLRKAEAKSAANGRDTATPIAAMGEGADMLETAEPRSEPRSEPTFEPKSESASESTSELAPAGGTDARQ